MSNHVLAVIPARGGSKGIPRKNLRTVQGHPLIHHTIAAAKQSHSVGRIVVSTDDPEIREVSLACGAEVIDRPAVLAADETPTLPVLQHAIQELEKESWIAEVVVLLQATVPYRVPGDIDAAVKMLRSEQADAVIGVVRSPASRDWIFRLQDGQIVFYQKPDFSNARRQTADIDYRINGSIYVYKAEVVKTAKHYPWGDKVLGYVMDFRRSWDIDEPLDLKIAETLFSLDSSE
jgi:CMP-N,N'-diacetyllegionaminic acid synthase